MIDLATRERAALLAEVLNTTALALEERKGSASDQEYLALEEAHDAAEITYEEFGHPTLLRNDGSQFRCPMCKCQLLESDMEEEE